MKKLLISLLFCASLAVSVFSATLLTDRQALQEELIRLHVVADSDSPEDQRRKLQVRDAVLRAIGDGMKQAGDAQAAKAYLLENLPEIQTAARDCLQALGCQDGVSVTLCREDFPRRLYDTFALPAGIYEALRITIGKGEGHNWWCVAFPSLCVPAVSGDVETAANAAGLPDSLTGAMTGRYRLRFYLLDLLGSWETGRSQEKPSLQFLPISGTITGNY